MGGGGSEANVTGVLALCLSAQVFVGADFQAAQVWFQGTMRNLLLTHHVSRSHDNHGTWAVSQYQTGKFSLLKSRLVKLTKNCVLPEGARTG